MSQNGGKITPENGARPEKLTPARSLVPRDTTTVRKPASELGKALGKLWKLADQKIGAPPVTTSQSRLGDEIWGVTKSTAGDRLEKFEKAGIIEVKRTNRCTHVTFLRPPTEAELTGDVRPLAPSSFVDELLTSGRSAGDRLEGGELPVPTGDRSTGDRLKGGELPVPTGDRSTGDRLEGGELPVPTGNRTAAVRPDGERLPAPTGDRTATGRVIPMPTRGHPAAGRTPGAAALAVADDADQARAQVIGLRSAHGRPMRPELDTSSDDVLLRRSPTVAAAMPLDDEAAVAAVHLPLFRRTLVLRLVSAGAVAVSIAMIAFHSAGAAAASAFHWWTTLAMAIILSTGKVALGSQAEAFHAEGEKLPGLLCVVGAIFLLSVDATLLYAFRGDSLSTVAAQETATIETRERTKARLDGLLAEQKQLREADLAPPPAPVRPEETRLVGEIQLELNGLDERYKHCRLVRRKKERVVSNPARCEAKRTALKQELTRATKYADDVARWRAAADRRGERLAALPDLVAQAEADLQRTPVRAASDHGAGIVARGLNWIPAGVTGLIWGTEVRPVAGRGVEIFWSWAFVLAAEIFAVFGFAVAARADRSARLRKAKRK